MTIARTTSIPTRLCEAVATRTSRTQHTALAVGSVVALGATNTALDASYASSRHPVSYAEGQLAFDGATIKGYYAHMTELGTLDTYVATQLIDFGFIASVAAVGVFLATRIARAHGTGRAAMAAAVAAILLLTGAALDALENAISFVMLADPTGFPDLLAIPYSSAAALKFLCITAGMALFGGSALLAAGRVIANRVGRGPAAVV